MSGLFKDLETSVQSSLDPFNLTGLNNGNSVLQNVQNTLDPAHLWSKGSSFQGPSGMTPEEQAAYNAAQPFLQEYGSGKLNSSDQALVNQADTNATETALQSFANAGMTNSSSRVATTGKVTKGTDTTGLQAGAGSSIDVQKATNTQQILQSDLNNALAYLGVASGDAAALSAVNLTANQNVADSLAQASKSFGNIYSGPGQTSGFDMNAFKQFITGMNSGGGGG